MAIGLFSFVLLTSLVASSQPEVRRPAERMPGLEGLSDVALVAPGIYRGGTPSSKGVKTLSALGVKTIVNLRHYHHKSEEKDAKKAGITYVWLPIASSGEPSAETLERFLAVIQDTNARPVYVHCYRGKDRTGSMIAAYRMLVEGWPKAEAIKEMQEYGFFDGWRRLMRWVQSLEPRP